MRQTVIDKLMKVNEDNILQRSFLWNMVASLLNAITSAVFLFFITRFCGVNQAGVFSIASALAYQCISLGNFGTRGIQASDIKNEYSFSDYFYVRLFSYGLMMALLLYYAFCSGYTLDKSLTIFCFGLFKSVDVIEDLYHGEYHRHQRLDVASILLTFRSLSSIIIFITCIILTKSVFLSSLLSFIFTFIIFMSTNKEIIRIFFREKYRFSFDKFKGLLFVLIPIVIATYIRMYITNAPKYAIDANLGDVDQAYFNVLFMPVFVIGLISDIIFRPYIPQFSLYWNQNEFGLFKKLLFRQLLFILGITLIVVLGGYILGLTLLEMIYGMQLHQYMLSFLILLVGGGISTLSAFMLVVITVIRAQKKIALINILAFIICLLIMNPLVINYGIHGAVWIYVILNIISSLLSFLIVVYEYRRKKGGRQL